MKTLAKIIFLLSLLSILGYYLIDFIGGITYDKQHWTYRKASQSIKESKKRGVFVKELSFSIDSFFGSTFNFEPFVERAFTHGYKSVDETILMKGTNYPFRLSFNPIPQQSIGIYIRPDQLKKFDSADAVWGYLKYPYLNDTIILEIRGEGIKHGIIKVW